MVTRQAEKLGAIPPTDPDDIIQTPKYTIFLANFRILGVKKLLGTDQFLMRYA